MTDPAPSSVPPQRRYSGGQVAMIVIGAILLLPGICSLFFFAVMSGDINPAHVDEEYARSDLFHKIIAHGMWGGSLISTLLGTIAFRVLKRRVELVTIAYGGRDFAEDLRAGRSRWRR